MRSASTSSISSGRGEEESSQNSEEMGTSEAEAEHNKISLQLLEAIHRLKKAKAAFYRAKAIADDFDETLNKFKIEKIVAISKMKADLEAFKVEKQKELCSQNVSSYSNDSTNSSSSSASYESSEVATKYVSASTDYECMLDQQDKRMKEIELACERVDALVEDFDNELLDQAVEKCREMKRFLREYKSNIAPVDDNQAP